MIGRKTQAVHQQLAAIKGAEARRQRIAEPDNAEQLVSVTETVFENCSAA
jgi:hypothetical protein